MLVSEEDTDEMMHQRWSPPCTSSVLPSIQNSCWARAMWGQSSNTNTQTQSNSSHCRGPGQQPVVPISWRIYQEINYYRIISTQKCLLYPNYFIVYKAISCAIKPFVYQAAKVACCRIAVLAYCVWILSQDALWYWTAKLYELAAFSGVIWG